MIMITFKRLFWVIGDREFLAGHQTKLGYAWRVSVHLAKDVRNTPTLEFSAERVDRADDAALLHQGGDLETAIAHCDADFLEQSVLLFQQISGDSTIVGALET
jgi:hypothetical protein